MRFQNAISCYMQCIECSDGELDALLSLNKLKMTYYLEKILRYGPSGTEREVYRQKVLATYADIEAYQKTQQAPLKIMDKVTYERYYLKSFDNLYRLRALKALRAMGISEAEDAIKKISSDDFNKISPFNKHQLSEDVKKAINRP